MHCFVWELLLDCHLPCHNGSILRILWGAKFHTPFYCVSIPRPILLPHAVFHRNKTELLSTPSLMSWSCPFSTSPWLLAHAFTLNFEQGHKLLPDWIPLAAVPEPKLVPTFASIVCFSQAIRLGDEGNWILSDDWASNFGSHKNKADNTVHCVLCSHFASLQELQLPDSASESRIVGWVKEWKAEEKE